MSFNYDLSIGSKLARFLPAPSLPAPSTVLNIALGLSFFLTVQHLTAGEDPLTLAMDAIGDLFSSTKPEEMFVPLIQVSPTPTIKPPPTPTLPESTSGIFYAVALCVIFILVGTVFIVSRKNSSVKISSPSAVQTCDNESPSRHGNIPEDLRSRSTIAPNNDYIRPSENSCESKARIWKFTSAHRPGTPAHVIDGQVMKFKVDANEFVHAIENSKVDINIIRDKVVPASKAPEVFEEKKDETVSRRPGSEESGIATPPETPPPYLVYFSPKHVHSGNRRARRAALYASCG